VPVAAPAPPAPVPAARVALVAEHGAWTRVGDALVAMRRGATLVAHRVTARRLVLLVRTGPRAGVIEVSWRDRRIRRIDLGAARRGTRSIVLAARRHARTGTLRIRVVRAGRVAIRGVAVR
jgi:hypothetical protein